MSLSASELLGLVKMFEMERTVKDASLDMDVNLKTTKRVFHKIRLAVTGTSENEFEVFDEILKGESPEFSIVSLANKISISLEKVESERVDLLTLVRTRKPDKEASYSFKFSKMTSKNLDKKLSHFPMQINYFWRYARTRLLDYRGTNLKYLYLYLLEVTIRYNHRNDSYYEILVKKIAPFRRW